MRIWIWPGLNFFLSESEKLSTAADFVSLEEGNLSLFLWLFGYPKWGLYLDKILQFSVLTKDFHYSEFEFFLRVIWKIMAVFDTSIALI